MYSNIVPLLYWYIREQELTCSSRVWYHPDLLLQPTVRHPVFNQPVSGLSDTLLVLASWSLIWKHCRAAERHWKADQSHIAAELDLTSSTCGGLGFDVTLQDGRLLGVCRKPRRAPYASVCISMCLHSVKCAQRTWKHTWKNGVKKREKKNQHSCDWGTKNNTLGCVTKSLAFFYLFIFYRGGVQTCNPTPENLSLRLSVVMETSQVSVLPAVAPAVHCGICGSVLKTFSVGPNIARPSAKPTNQPTSAVYCLCERSLGTFACRPAQKNLKVTSILFCS